MAAMLHTSNDYTVRFWRRAPAPLDPPSPYDAEVKVAADSIDTAVAAARQTLDFEPARYLARRDR